MQLNVFAHKVPTVSRWEAVAALMSKVKRPMFQHTNKGRLNAMGVSDLVTCKRTAGSRVTDAAIRTMLHDFCKM